MPVKTTAKRARGKSGKAARIALVNMPFAMADRPSIQCGLLKAGLQRAGHAAEVFYFNLRLAAGIGAEPYKTISQLRTDQFLGEWLFSAAAFEPADDEEEYRKTCPSLEETCLSLGCDFNELVHLRREVFPELIQSWADEVDWSRYHAVGFTSTFEQNTASFALAKAIKQRHPEIPLIFGGANFDGEMGREYLRALPFVDCVVGGEGDAALVELAERLARGRPLSGIAGVAGRNNGSFFDGGPAASIGDLNALPDPNYDEYFQTLFELGREQVLGDSPPLLLVETARGCWWGEKHHCTFCGLNAATMRFRSKPASRVAEELRRLSARYKIVNFEAVDNIMDLDYLRDLCGRLSGERTDYQIFYEVKANLTREQLRTMAQAGVASIQPGIESLSTRILGLMRKGATRLINLRLLKWAHYYGMRVGWNILTGFPGESVKDYDDQLELIPLLRHLPPPSGCGPVWLERFSPYFFDKSFPVRNVRPRRAYSFIYPEDRIELDKIAYFFDHEMDSTVAPEHCERLYAAIDEWKARWDAQPTPALVYQRAPDWIQVIDRRGEQAAVHAFQRIEALVYEFCGETDRTPRGVRRHLREAGEASVKETEVKAVLDRFCELGLMARDEDRYLSLAMPVNPNW